MNFKFECSLCKKKVERGEKFCIEADCYETNTTLNGEFDTGDICKECTVSIQRVVDSLRVYS